MTIVVLGGGLTKEEKLPDQVKRRLDKALKISKKRKIDSFLTCGKYSFLLTKEDRPQSTEARLMKNYLISKKVDRKKIHLEEKSMDTISNAYYAKTEYFIPQNETEGIIITSAYHIPRTKYIFEKIFGTNFNLEFEGIETGANDRLLKRQGELLNKFMEMTQGMKTGDHQFLKDKFFEDDYYKEERPSWVKKKVARG